jgi:exodeoxyribonuclease V beta subunit
VLAPDDEDLAWAEQERLREDLRLFYVALTRARHALWLGFTALTIGNSPACQTHRSAAGWLLAGPEATTPEALAQALAGWAAGCPDIALQPAGPAVGLTPLAPREAPLPLAEARSTPASSTAAGASAAFRPWCATWAACPAWASPRRPGRPTTSPMPTRRPAPRRAPPWRRAHRPGTASNAGPGGQLPARPAGMAGPGGF